MAVRRRDWSADGGEADGEREEGTLCQSGETSVTEVKTSAATMESIHLWGRFRESISGWGCILHKEIHLGIFGSIRKSIPWDATENSSRRCFRKSISGDVLGNPSLGMF